MTSVRALTCASIGITALIDFALGGLAHLGDIIIAWTAVLQLVILLVGVLYAQIPRAATHSRGDTPSLPAVDQGEDEEKEQLHSE